MWRSSGSRRVFWPQAKTSSITLAVVAPEYCGYSGTTSTRVTPSALKASSWLATLGWP